MLARRTVITATLAAVVSAAGAACGRRQESSGTPGGGFAAGSAVEETFTPDQRQPAPQVTGELLAGTRFDLAGWAGKVVVLNWWGSWCAPCRLEAKRLEAAYQTTKDLGVEYLGVNVRDDRDKAIAFTEDFGITYPSLFDPAGRIALLFKGVPATVLPTTLLLDRRHRPAVIFRRVVEQEELETGGRALAGEAA